MRKTHLCLFVQNTHYKYHAASHPTHKSSLANYITTRADPGDSPPPVPLEEVSLEGINAASQVRAFSRVFRGKVWSEILDQIQHLLDHSIDQLRP